MENILICTIKSWNIKHFYKLKNKLKDSYNLILISDKNNLKLDYLYSLKPKYIFFPHWSWIIPNEVINNFECIIFHMTDLPYGRGGSPLQNLIIRKNYNTKISALKAVEELDAGDIYLKKDFYIGNGSCEEIFIKLSEIIFFEMIPEIVNKNIVPVKQEGNIVHFKRRKKEDSNILNNEFYSLLDFYDFIRMLDGEGYPNAFIKIKNFKINFTEAHIKNDKVVGRFEIIENE